MSRIPKSRFCNMLAIFGVDSEYHEDDLHDEILTLNAITEIGDNVSISIDDIIKETQNDSCMTKLILHINNGFPATQHLTDHEVRPYFNVKEHLWIQKRMVMFKNRIVIPKSLRPSILKTLHAAHQGVEGMKSRAMKSIYWPGINESIQRTRTNCQACTKIAPSQPREPLCLIPPASYPFQQICMDAFEISSNQYLALVDRYSRWLVIFHVKTFPQGVYY